MSSAGGTFAPPCASARLPTPARRWRQARVCRSVPPPMAKTVSGKLAIVEKSHEFTLVPWRPVIDRQLGREVMGVMQGGSVSWQLGRQRGLGL